jgi:transposase-like protein
MNKAPEKSIEIKCPYCECEDVVPTGGSHVTGVGQPHREPDQIGYECLACKKTFHLLR